MTPLLAFAQNTTYELTPSFQRLPPFIWTAFTTLNKIHGLWRWYRRIELYRQPDNFAQLLAGHLLNFTIGDQFMLRVAAQCLLISTRVLECSQQQIEVYQASQRWMGAIQGHYPKPINISWNKEIKTYWISPSSSDWIQLKNQAIWNRLTRTIKRTIEIFFHLFKLSMKMMDVIDVFCMSPATTSEGINESFVNTMKWLDNLVENKEELLSGLTSNQVVIEKILRGSPFSYLQLHTCVSKTLEKAEVTYQKAKTVSEFSNGIIVDLGKRILSGSMVMIGLADYRPPLLV